MVPYPPRQDLLLVDVDAVLLGDVLAYARSVPMVGMGVVRCTRPRRCTAGRAPGCDALCGGRVWRRPRSAVPRPARHLPPPPPSPTTQADILVTSDHLRCGPRMCQRSTTPPALPTRLPACPRPHGATALPPLARRSTLPPGDTGLELPAEAQSPMNIGFMFFRFSNRTTAFVQQWLDAINADPDLWDQNAFNILARDGWDPVKKASTSLCTPRSTTRSLLTCSTVENRGANVGGPCATARQCPGLLPRRRDC